MRPKWAMVLLFYFNLILVVDFCSFFSFVFSVCEELGLRNIF